MGAKVGIIGCGRWGSVHLKTLVQLKHEGLVSEIHGCDINPEKGIEFADLLTTFSTDWQELVNQEKLTKTERVKVFVTLSNYIFPKTKSVRDKFTLEKLKEKNEDLFNQDPDPTR